MLLSNKVYDILKYVAQYVLPGLGTLYFALSTIWGLPYGEQVVGTITAVDAFLGVLLGISTNAYNKSDAAYDGHMVVNTTDPLKDIYSMELNADPASLKDKNQVTFKVDTTSSTTTTPKKTTKKTTKATKTTTE